MFFYQRKNAPRLRSGQAKIHLAKTLKMSFIFSVLFLCFSVSLFLSPPKALASEITEQKLIELANQERLQHGLNTLSIDPLLYFAAQNKAQDMVNNHYFDHYTPDGRSPWNFINAVGYNYLYAGENLAMDFRTAEGVHKAWLSSSPHRDNILNPRYEDIAIAVVKGQINNHQTTLVVEMFGTKDTTIFGQVNALVSKITGLILGQTSLIKL